VAVLEGHVADDRNTQLSFVPSLTSQSAQRTAHCYQQVQVHRTYAIGIEGFGKHELGKSAVDITKMTGRNHPITMIGSRFSSLHFPFSILHTPHSIRSCFTRTVSTSKNNAPVIRDDSLFPELVCTLSS